MTIGMLLDMVASANSDRALVSTGQGALTGADLADHAAGGAAEIVRRRAEHVIYVGVNSPALPVTMLASALAGVPLSPLNYRLAPTALRQLVTRLPAALVITDREFCAVVEGLPGIVGAISTERWMQICRGNSPDDLPQVTDDTVAVVLFTSGTTARPKAVLLRHSHLVSYVLQTVEFAHAAPEEAALVSVPPYHIAGVGCVLTNLFAGRRLSYLADFTGPDWLATVRREKATHAMLVPTMLARLVDHLDGATAQVPTLRAIAYGGARLPTSVLARVLAAFPGVGFTNAYGLTETSSTIAVFGPEDHRLAASSADPRVRARLASAGRFLPGVEAQIRDCDGTVVPPGTPGELWVRGAQVSGEYAELGSQLAAGGWFPTRDRAHLDDEGYLFIEGRADDTVIRGGENIAPAEVEEVLLEHPSIAEAAVFGVPDEKWGERLVAAVVLRADAPEAAMGHVAQEPFREWVRARLRSSRTPDQILFPNRLPYTETGKLLRRELIDLATPTAGSLRCN